MQIQCGLRLNFKWPLEELVLLFPCCRVQFFFQGKCISAMSLNTYYLFKIFVLSTEFHLCKFQSGHLYCGFILMKNWVDVQWVIQSLRLNYVVKWRYIIWIKKRVKKNLYLEKIRIVWWTLLYFWLSSWYVICQTLFQNPVHFYDLAACRELSGWRTDEEENHGVPQSAVSGDLEFMVAFTANSPWLTGMCCPGVRLRGSACFCPMEEALSFCSWAVCALARRESRQESESPFWPYQQDCLLPSAFSLHWKGGRM